jgi:hypothetical protein
VACAHATDDIVEDDPDLSQETGASGKAGSAGHGGGESSARAGTSAGGANVAGKSAGGNGGNSSATGGGTKSGGGASGGGGTSVGTSGNGGTGGASGGGGGSAGALGSGGAVNAGTVELDYKSENTDPADNQIRMSLRVKSTAAAPIALSSLELRYYFTSEVALPLVVEMYDASVANAAVSYHAVSHDAVKTMVQGASSYLSVTFAETAGMLTMGDALTLDIAVHGQNWTGNFTETNDYSFAPDHTDFAPWDHVTVFAPTLIWGQEPM